jgi:predicted GIY-YIG superfamily endonuclease
MRAPDHDGPTALYRLFDIDDVLIYAGISKEPTARFAAHRASKAWWAEVRRIDIQWHASRTDAAQAEIDLIRAERPRYNVAVPDDDGRFTIGVGRPRWEPDDDLAGLLVASVVEATKTAAEAETALWASFAEARSGGVPIVYLVKRTGIPRATVYRHLPKTRRRDAPVRDPTARHLDRPGDD